MTRDGLFVDCETGVFTCPPDSRVLFDQRLAAAREGGFEDALGGFWRASRSAEG